MILGRNMSGHDGDGLEPPHARLRHWGNPCHQRPALLEDRSECSPTSHTFFPPGLHSDGTIRGHKDHQWEREFVESSVRSWVKSKNMTVLMRIDNDQDRHPAVCICVYILYIYRYWYSYLLSFPIICVYIYIYVCVCVHVYIYIYIQCL